MARYRIWLRSTDHKDIPRYRDVVTDEDHRAVAHARRYLAAVNHQHLASAPYDRWEVRELTAHGRESRLVSWGITHAP